MINSTILQSAVNAGNYPDSDGSVECGTHSIHDFEVYKTEVGLLFMYHDDPEDLQEYSEVEAFFQERDEDLGKQLEEQGLA